MNKCSQFVVVIGTAIVRSTTIVLSIYDKEMRFELQINNFFTMYYATFQQNIKRQQKINTVLRKICLYLFVI